MASPVKLRPQQPDALPADFAEWDGDQVPSTLPEDFFDEEGSVVEPTSPSAIQAKEAVTVPPVAVVAPPTKEASPTSRQPATKPTAKPKSKNLSSDRQVSPSPAPARSAAPSILTSATVESQPKSNRPLVVVLGSAAGVLLAVTIGWKVVEHHNNAPSTPSHQVAVTDNAATQTSSLAPPPQVDTTGKPSADVPMTPSVTDNTHTTTAAAAVPVPSTPIKQQNGPSILPSHLKGTDDAPPPQVASPAMGGSMNSLDLLKNLNSNVKTPVVTHTQSKPLDVSGGIIGGQLIQRTEPVYPPIAKGANISGAVVLGTTISKAGVPTNIRVLSGHPMLRQAAMDAVRNWRYKPYLLDGQPIEVNTTITINFVRQ